MWFFHKKVFILTPFSPRDQQKDDFFSNKLQIRMTFSQKRNRFDNLFTKKWFWRLLHKSVVTLTTFRKQHIILKPANQIRRRLVRWKALQISCTSGGVPMLESYEKEVFWFSFVFRKIRFLGSFGQGCNFEGSEGQRGAEDTKRVKDQVALGVWEGLGGR